MEELKHNRGRGGFTIFELILVFGTVAILSTIAIGSYMGAHRRAVLDSTAQGIMIYLRSAQQKSLSQEEGLQWGVHLENPSPGSPSYALFYGNPYNSGNVRERIYLPKQLKYLVPAEGGSIDVMFAKLTGTPASTSSIEITFKSAPAGTTNKRTITVNSAGTVTIQ